MTNTENAKKPAKTPRVDMPCQPAAVRAHNFKEVALGYSLEQAQLEASRCLQCKNPRCITSIEQELPHIFYLADEEKEVYRCQYCDEKYSL